MKIDIPPDLEAALRAAAEDFGATPEEVAEEMLRELMEASGYLFPSLSEKKLERGQG